MIKINMFKAGFGDSFLVQISPYGEDETNIMIDCGFGYRDNILPRLKSLLGREGKIDRFIITHFDNDHIQGAISFFEENGNSSEPTLFKVSQVWLNTFRHLQFHKRVDKQMELSELKRINAFMGEASLKNRSTREEGAISAEQASNLGCELLRKKYSWNADSNAQAICIENLKNLVISKNVCLSLLSPDIESLKKLEIKYLNELKKMNLEPNDEDIFDDAFELYMRSIEIETKNKEGVISAKVQTISTETIKEYSKGNLYKQDDSIGNKSSIAFILESQGKKILFLGDAHAEDIIVQLGKIYPRQNEYPIFFDAIKVSHHGSFKNNSPELYEIIDSGKFLFSTNGKHPKHIHPDIETIAFIINRPLPKNIDERELYFNYKLEHLIEFNDVDLMKEFKYCIKIQEEIIT